MFPCVQWGLAWRARSRLVGFAIAVHVVDVCLHLSAVETVQETTGDLCHHGSVWDRLGHAIDCSLKTKTKTGRQLVKIYLFRSLVHSITSKNTDDLLFSAQPVSYRLCCLIVEDQSKTELLI